LLPTPNASGFASTNNGCPWDGRAQYATKAKPTLVGLARKGMLPAPTVKGNYNRAGASSKAGDGLATTVGGPLNPRFVEWLMGFPDGWTDCGPSETPSSRSARKSSGD
jgi:hypothetical protein